MSRRALMNMAVAGGAALVLALAGAVGFASEVRRVDVRDSCDGRTFNQVLGKGACNRKDGMPFDKFIAELTRKQTVEAWRFNPDELELDHGEAFQAVNRGGETHTFTEVETFGGGLVPLLNDLSGNPKVAPECDPANPEINFLPSGASTDPDVESPGVHHYQCCIHPWMRTDVIVR